MMTRPWLCCVLSLGVLAGCGDDPPAVSDAGTLDAGTLDAGALDAGAPDATLTDTGPDVVDAGEVDAGVTLARVQAEVFTPRCAIPSCHAGAEPTGRLVLEGDGVRAALLGVSGMGVQCRGVTATRVVAGDPMASLLFLKISEDMPPCGTRMPQAAPPLEPALIALVRQWIAEGAR